MQGGACPTVPGPLYPTWTISTPPPQFRHISYLPDSPLLGSGPGQVTGKAQRCFHAIAFPSNNVLSHGLTVS